MNCLKYAYKCAGEEIREACGFLLFEAEARLSLASLRVEQQSARHSHSVLSGLLLGGV